MCVLQPVRGPGCPTGVYSISPCLPSANVQVQHNMHVKGELENQGTEGRLGRENGRT